MRILEPHRGVDFDTTVIGWGAGAVLVLIVLLGVVSALRRRTPAPQRASRLGEALARMGAPVPTVTGVRMALDPGHGDAAVPVWSTVMGVGLALAALVATFGYTASLTHFTSTPRLYGWVWTAQVESSSGSSVAEMQRAAATLTRDPSVHAAVGGYAQMEIAGKTVGAVALEPNRGVPVIEVMRGRAPARDDEIAFGATTLHTLHRRVGDQVDVAIGSVRHPFRIVGQAVFPRFAPYPASEPTGLGVGAATTLDGLRRFGPLDDSDRSPLSATAFLLADGPEPRLDQRLRTVVLHGDPNGGLVLHAQRPNDVASYANLKRTPLALVGLLVLLAVATLAHLLVTAVRRRRKDLAMLRALGCRAAQVRRVVLVQATTLITLALVVAVPLGVIAGRLLWSATAHWLGVPVSQVVPAGEVALVIVGAFVVGIAAALVPATRAGRVDPAEILRAE
jgi:putative ABC transport system permease protein